jgi:enoyl-[acyl-carrier protein] reductase I
MLPIDLRGKRALVAGVADDGGFGFAIAKALAEAGATVCVGSWPPAMGIFEKLLARGKMDDSLTLSDGSKMAFEADLPPGRRLRHPGGRAGGDPGEQALRRPGGLHHRRAGRLPGGGLRIPLLDILVHSLANGPEVQKPLLETSRRGYLEAIGTSAYSQISLIRALGPLFRPGASALSLTYLASERAVPGYGGGMSSAKAALESDTRTLAWEAGKSLGLRVNTISAGPYASRAASAIGFVERMIRYYEANAPIPRSLEAMDVGHAAAFLASPLAAAITGTVLYVDNGYHAMGAAMSAPELGVEE